MPSNAAYRACIVPMLILLLVSGCVLVTDTVDLQYHSSSVATPVPGAGPVMVKVVDGRTGRASEISRKMEGFGGDAAAILSARTVPEIVKNAITEELRKRGFKIEPSR